MFVFIFQTFFSEENLQIQLSIFIFNNISVPKIHKYDTIQYMNIKINKSAGEQTRITYVKSVL